MLRCVNTPGRRALRVRVPVRLLLHPAARTARVPVLHSKEKFSEDTVSEHIFCSVLVGGLHFWSWLGTPSHQYASSSFCLAVACGALYHGMRQQKWKKFLKENPETAYARYTEERARVWNRFRRPWTYFL